MPIYVIEYRAKAYTALRALPKHARQLVMTMIEGLMVDPRPEGSELVEDEGERFYLWTIDGGSEPFLVAYEIHDRRLVIVVLSVAKG